MAAIDKREDVIVAIDDQPAILHTVAMELKHLYKVKSFTSGASALKYFEQQTADLVILDYQMPNMTGIEVLSKLQSNPSTQKIPVIFLTGSDGDNIEVEALNKGAADYISKPIKGEILLTRIRLQLELKLYRDRMEALVEEKTEHLRQANEKLKLREDITLSLLAEVTEMRDNNTGEHIRRTTEIVRIIVMDLLNHPVPGYTFTQQEAADIIKSAKLHDLGKIAIIDKILLKPGKLDEDEFEIIKQHPLHGIRLLDKYNTQMSEDYFLNTARAITLYHHEKWNGKGYPHGLKEKNIPLSARITALADVYDALTSVRPYKLAFSHEKALEIITNESAKHFDPYLVDVFIRNEQKIKETGRV